jgi:probable DNA repair protein
MLPSLIDINLFREPLEAGNLILTPNHRLAAQIAQSWSVEMRQHKAVWNAPRVYSIDHWLRHCWDELQDQNHTLVSGLAIVGQQQSRYYWDRAIADCGAQSAIDASTYADGRFSKLASDTHRIVQNWNLSEQQIPKSTPSSRQFIQWVEAYNKLLSRNQLITIPASWQLVAQGFAQSALAGEDKIALYGFQSMPPAQQAVIAQATDCQQPITPQAIDGDGYLVACADPQQELIAATQWAAQQLAENPNQRIGLIIPELDHSLTQVSRLTAESLTDQGVDVAVNISAGTALIETTVVRGAIELLGIFQYQRPLSQWLELLYSPYSVFSQLPVQVLVDVELAVRDSKAFDFTLEQFLNHVSTAVRLSPHADSIALQLKPVFECRSNHRKNNKIRQSFSQWQAFFERSLSDLGWPGQHKLDTFEYQQREHWQRLLEQFCRLDNLGIEVGLTTARKHLVQMAQDAVFHPQTGDAPLQILGLLEGAGLKFDQLWIVGMHSQNFPAAVNINPLLPVDFQRCHAMPHSLPDRELNIAKALWRDYRSNARRLIASYPLLRGEEQLTASPLVFDVTRVALDQLVGNIKRQPYWLERPDKTELVAETTIAYNPEREKIKGGSTLLKNQSTLPFNAFAVHRLWAEPLQQPIAGLTAMDRGILLHDILYRLWGEWHNAAHLHSLSEQQISDALEQVIEQSLTALSTQHPVLLGSRFRQLEHSRLQKLITAWLAQEKSRPAFEVIGREQLTSVDFGDLQITLRLDRIDQMDGQSLVIDYKSGEVTPSHWQGDRPKDPQLPLYIMATKPPASGCAFAQIKGGNIKFIGIGESSFFEQQTVIDNWPEQLEQWRKALSNLAYEFSSGFASIEIYDSAVLNFQEYLLPLNRYFEAANINAQLSMSEAD